MAHGHDAYEWDAEYDMHHRAPEGTQCHDVYEPLASDLATAANRRSPKKGFSGPVLVRTLMTSDPVTVPPTASVPRVAAVMIEHDLNALPVVDEGGQLVGVVSEADLIVRKAYPTVRSHTLAGAIGDALDEHRHHWQQRASGVTANSLMTTDVVTCRPTEPVGVATRRLLSHRIRSLPVVEDGRVVGILSRGDVLRLLDQPDSEIRDNLAMLQDDPLWMPDEHAVTFSVNDGVVTMSGSVLYPSDAQVVHNIVQQLPGVVRVIDELTWRKSDPKPSYLRDTDVR
jgi:CBS domain-containing protein